MGLIVTDWISGYNPYFNYGSNIYLHVKQTQEFRDEGSE